MKIALLFPGQGAQFVGMGKDFYDQYDKAKKIFDQADEILGHAFSKIIFEGPENVLTETKNSQLAIFIVSCAIFEVMKTQFSFEFQITAGLSLGEYTALYAAGYLDFKSALLLIQKRAEFMNEACEKNLGTMAAVMGLDPQKIEALSQEVEGAWVANFNTPQQTVISGTVDGIEALTKKLKAAGAKRVIPLKVHGAFHSGLMKEAADKLSPFVEKVSLKPSDIAVVMNVTGKKADTTEMKNLLVKQVTHSVRWSESIQNMSADCMIEMGPGKTLTAMNKKMGVKNAYSISNVEDVNQMKEVLHDAAS